MDIAIIITTPDFAGLNIKNNLLDNYKFQKQKEKKYNYSIYKIFHNGHNIIVYTTDERCVFLERIDKEIKANLFLIPTTHRSTANTHSLSVHTQGNWNKADLGGQPKNLSICPAIWLKEFFITLNSFSELIDEEITMEVTHHGPQIESPTIFLEIGSDESQWKRPELGKIIADTIMKTLNSKPPKYKTAIGIGGPHYCNNFNNIQLESEIAIGHICPKYMLEHLDKEMIEQAINKTQPKPELVIFDWKGLGKEKQRIIQILDELNIKWKKTKEIKRVSNSFKDLNK